MNKTRRFALTAGLLVTSIALAQGVQRVLSLVVNGQIISAKAIVQGRDVRLALGAWRAGGQVQRRGQHPDADLGSGYPPRLRVEQPAPGHRGLLE